MDNLIDLVLEAVLRSVIWRSTWHMPLAVLIGVGVIAFLLLAYRRGSTKGQRRNKSRRRYKSRFWDK